MTEMNRYRDLLDKIYLSTEGKSGAFGSVRHLWEAAKKISSGIKRSDVVKYLETIQGYSRHARILRKFPRRSFLSTGLNEFFQIDVIYLSDMKKITRAKVHNQYSYGLTAIDVWSRFGFCQPMRRKRPIDAVEAFSRILDSAGKQPILVQADYGGEFKNLFASFCKGKGIKLFSSTSSVKASICEGFNYNLKLILNRILSQFNTNDWVKYLQLAVKIYNEQPTSALPDRLSPAAAQKPKNQPKIQLFHLKKRALLAAKIFKSRPHPRFKIGDSVRKVEYSGSGGLSNRGFKPRFSKEIYKIQSISKTLPRGYFIGLYKNENPHFFYANELRLASKRVTDHPLILSIIKSREKVLSYLRNGKPRDKETQYLVVADNRGKPTYLNKAEIEKYQNGAEKLKEYHHHG